MRVRANGIAIEVERSGDPDGVPVLMIMGLAMQLIAWPRQLIDGLVAQGLAPVSFDNRDCGLSEDFEAAGTPNVIMAAMRHTLHLPVDSPYTLADMAGDAAGVLDALGIAAAHVVGVSMGGMIAQEMAARHAGRVRSLTLIMTTSGARHLPGPTWRARNAMLSRPAGRDTESRVAHGVGILRVIGSPRYPADETEMRARVRRAVERAWRPRGITRQLCAVIASGDRSALLSSITRPTLVVHGRDDPLVPAACGYDLARRIPGAALEVVDGMGHDLPVELMPWLATRIADHCTAAR